MPQSIYACQFHALVFQNCVERVSQNATIGVKASDLKIRSILISWIYVVGRSPSVAIGQSPVKVPFISPDVALHLSQARGTGH